MSWSGDGHVVLTNGRFSGENLFQRIADANDENVRADRFDALVADLVATIENCLTRDGQNALLGALQMGGQRIRNIGEAVQGTDAVQFAQMTARLGQGDYIAAANVGGTADAIELTPSPALTAHVTGGSYRWVVKAENAGAVTMEVSGLAAVRLRKLGFDGTVRELAPGDLRVGAEVRASFDGAQYIVVAGVPTLHVMTQQAYDALAAPAPGTLYAIVG